MDATAVVIITATIFFWGIVSARLQRADTAPIVFMVVGAILARLDPRVDTARLSNR